MCKSAWQKAYEYFEMDDSCKNLPYHVQQAIIKLHTLEDKPEVEAQVVAPTNDKQKEEKHGK